MHAAEQTGEVEQCSPGRVRVRCNGCWITRPWTHRWCLVHSTHLDDHEVAGLAARRAVAGLCPITEANLGDGIFRATDYFAAQGRFGIGTDSNVSISVADELRQLEYSQRLRDRARNVVAGAGPSTGRTLFEGALRGGSQALGVATSHAGIAKNGAADFVSLRLDAPAFAHRSEDSLLDSWIFAGVKNAIDGVWRAGKKVVSEGKHHARDAAERSWREALGRLLKE